MKSLLLLSVLLAFLSTLVLTAVSPAMEYRYMTDMEVAKRQVDQISPRTSQIQFPEEGTVWVVGQTVTVTFLDDNYTDADTVSIFFMDKSEVLAGGLISQRSFTFVVPSSAVSAKNGTSMLVAVIRTNRYLRNVEAVNIQVRPS
ncbi:hypothetical protein BDB01DRAFT_780117 [Pilobolus umbonatus]|nr:hypothetical protein BDB01DRAFT_780117 [Pilobolus umbonatus]